MYSSVFPVGAGAVGAAVKADPIARRRAIACFAHYLVKEHCPELEAAHDAFDAAMYSYHRFTQAVVVKASLLVGA